MTKLQRITGKVFGATATATGDDPEIGQFGSALAGTYNGTTDVATIQNLAAWSNGFIDAVTPSNQYPPLPEMTGFGKVLSHQNCYLLQQGIPEWDSATTYYTNNFCSKEGRVFISIQDSNLNHDPITDNLVYWKEFNGSLRNIGELVTSLLPLTDAGLHLLDGSVISGSGIYAEFVDYIAGLYDDNPSAAYFTTEASWQTSVSTYGVCGKFVYDSVNNTVRLPKVTGFVEGTIDSSALGDLVQAGLPNIAGTHTADVTALPTGCFYETGVLQPYSSGDRSGEVIGLNASLSNPIYGRSTTVQPQSIKGFVYIVISTSAKTDIQVDIDDIATDLNGKADTDLSNISPSASGRNTIAGWSMPDFANSIQVSLPYTAPSNGYLLEQVASGGYVDLLINGSTTFYSGLSTENATRTLMYPIKVNDVITRADSNGNWYLYFIPVKGAN